MSETAPTDTTVKAAPPVDPTLPEEDSSEIPFNAQVQNEYVSGNSD